jgi:hypothetical protein
VGAPFKATATPRCGSTEQLRQPLSANNFSSQARRDEKRRRPRPPRVMRSMNSEDGSKVIDVFIFLHASHPFRLEYVRFRCIGPSIPSVPLLPCVKITFSKLIVVIRWMRFLSDANGPRNRGARPALSFGRWGRIRSVRLPSLDGRRSSPARRLGAKLWPFEGSLTALADVARLVLAETYPADSYGQVGVRFASGESNLHQPDRAKFANHITSWASSNNVTLSSDLVALVAATTGMGAQGLGPIFYRKS